MGNATPVEIVETESGEAKVVRRSPGLIALLWYVSAVLALGICVGTGLISDWGAWYSPSTPYRQQTEALLDGRLALSYSPADIQHDMAWGEGGVQHVWGLAVPFWRLPFEAMARVVGQEAFPDRVALGLAILLTAYLLLRIFTVDRSTRTIADWGLRLRENPERMVTVFLLLLFPPVLSICAGAFNVYEEVVAYGYLYSIALFGALVSFQAKPRLWLYLVIGMAGGLIGFVRPTMLAYGMATLLGAFLLTRFLRWPWKYSVAAPLLFGVGGLLLLWSNWIRFGSGFEFGHNLNLTGGEIYTTRFGAPFAEEPLWPAVKELLGSLFFVRELNGFDVHRADVVVWQSPTIRWRHFYFSAFNVSYLLVVLAGWLFCARRAVFFVKDRGWKQADSSLPNAPLLMAGAWSILAFAPLAGFYLNAFGMSSRYLIDFAPAVAVAMVGAVLGVRPLLSDYWRRAGCRATFIGLVLAWWSWEVVTADSHFPRTPVYNQAEALRATPAPSSPESLPTLPSEYAMGENFDAYGLRYNGRGWASDGRVEAVVVLFVENPKRLVLEVGPAEDRPVEEEDYGRIRAKIGREHLRVEAVEETEGGRRLIFSGPRRAAYREGIQMVSISFVLTDDYAERWHPFRLFYVHWSDNRDG